MGLNTFSFILASFRKKVLDQHYRLLSVSKNQEIPHPTFYFIPSCPFWVHPSIRR